MNRNKFKKYYLSKKILNRLHAKNYRSLGQILRHKTEKDIDTLLHKQIKNIWLSNEQSRLNYVNLKRLKSGKIHNKYEMLSETIEDLANFKKLVDKFLVNLSQKTTKEKIKFIKLFSRQKLKKVYGKEKWKKDKNYWNTLLFGKKVKGPSGQKIYGGKYYIASTTRTHDNRKLNIWVRISDKKEEAIPDSLTAELTDIEIVNLLDTKFGNSDLIDFELKKLKGKK